MFTVEKVQFTKSAHESETSINLEARRECEGIMKKIYEEDPSYWPYGLDMAAHDGGVYMIREASTKKPIGFTGWQERMDGPTKVGFYSIGILPEYRNNGYAKQAVAKLIAIKSANVDRVQALVMKHNKPSLALAEALNIPVVKAGSEKKANQIKQLLKMVGLGGIPAAAGMDALTYGREKSFEDYLNTPITTNRVVQALANTAFGSLMLKPGLGIPERIAVAAGIPAKDVAISAIPAIPSLTESVKDIADNKSQSLADLISALSPTQKALGLGVGAAGLLGGGYLAHKGIKSLRDLASAQQQANKGKIRVALPTKDPGDQETIVELPIDDLDVSRSQFEKLQRDLRRRIRKETKERTVQRTLGSLMEPKEANVKKGSLEKVKFLLNILNA
jgi:ribosomal protein S18 acetylase RimI-like enzyme